MNSGLTAAYRYLPKDYSLQVSPGVSHPIWWPPGCDLIGPQPDSESQWHSGALQSLIHLTEKFDLGQ